MKLMTKTVRKSLPPLYATEDNATAKAVVKYFDPTGACTWYASEFDGEDIFFGFVDMGSGYDAELGYFSLSELLLLNQRGTRNIRHEESLRDASCM